ncbi:carboxylesterase/lipase family protein [Phenylobacterium sp.]|jgi:para-nitrobenzyl esterase|uniref:carboxylesterase/lipase family protein n=1 Tax=Phenylobacterium sp. TaxID=1871053 RepID=UPI002E340B41|nr:carboxylesterase family protein [Phenylobacterium sp.]HEX2559559.1 carboxylesterase family protein [Phenylobacterium sp.]
MTGRLIAAAAAAALLAGSAGAAEPVKVKIDAGVLAGASEGGVNSFKGIPFAKPPVGELRWKPPVAPAGWSGERDATKFEPPCPQPINADGRPNGGGVSGEVSENCLYLNVWAPANAEKAPVIVWLYGGAGYLGGAHLGAYNGTSFARNGVVVVTTNYRLGALGYFAHPALTKAAAPGEPLVNYAMMDAVEALKWVRRNIDKFGGDPNNVTVMGQSAGGFMVVGLLSIPSAKGLFHKAVVQSGAGLRPGRTLADGEADGIKAATALGLPGAAATLEQLRALPPEAFVSKQETRSGIRGVVDGKFVTTTTLDALNAGEAHDVPLLVGSNNGEGGADGARKLVQLAAKGAPAYQYYFTYVPAWRTAAQPNGAPHSAELPYVFASLDTASTGGGSQATEADRAVAKNVNSCWVAFVKSSPADKAFTCGNGFKVSAYDPAADDVSVFADAFSVRKGAEIPNGPPASAAAPAAPGATPTAPAGAN